MQQNKTALLSVIKLQEYRDAIIKKLLLSFVFLFAPLLAQPILKLDTKGHTSFIQDIIVTKDKDIISASEDKTIRVWDSTTGREKRKILGEIRAGHEGKIFAIALSPDEEYLAVGGVLTGTEKSGKKNAIRIYNYSTGKLIKSIKGHRSTVLDLAFSRESNGIKYLISASGDETAKIWDVEDDFSLVDTIIYHSEMITAAKIIKKEKKYFSVTAGFDNQIVLYDIQEGIVVRSAKTEHKLTSLAINPKKQQIAVCGFDNNEIRIYDYDLELITTVKSETSPAGLAYSQDGNYLIAGVDGSPVNVNTYHTKNYKKKTTFSKHAYMAKSVAFLDKQHAVSAGGSNNEIYIWDRKTAKVKTKIIGAGRSITTLGIKGDNIAWGYKVDENCIARQCTQKSINLKTFVVSKSKGKYKHIQETNGDFTLKHKKGGRYGYYNAILEVKKKNKTYASIFKNAGNGLRHRCYGWYKDFIISGGDHGVLTIYNQKGKEIANLTGHTGEIWSIALDGDRLVSGSFDQTIKIWDLSQLKTKSKDIQTIRSQLTLFISKDNEYIAYTPEGFFDASKNGAKYIGYHINQGADKEAEFVTVESLYNTFYRPDLIQKALNGESLKHYAKNINIEKLLKDGLAPEVHILTKAQTTQNENLNLKVQVCPKGNGGYDNLALLIKGVPVSIIGASRAIMRKQKSKRDDCFVYDQTISLLGGENKIGFMATNKAGNISSKIANVKINFDDKKLKAKLRSRLSSISGKQNINDLHILAIAVNNYKDKTLKLNYSINDADKMIETVQKVAKPIFNKIHTYKLFDEEVTKEKIQNIFGQIKSTREDVFLLYIAGHGVTDTYNGQYYYIPYDFIDSDDMKVVQVQGVGQKDLLLSLSGITALKSLILLDTCESGSFVEANMLKTTTNRLAKATGRATISASSKSQVALEGFEGHGVFTYTLLEALKGKGYKDDNKITINELSDYVEDILPKRTYEKWKYRQKPQSSMFGIDFNLGFKED